MLQYVIFDTAYEISSIKYSAWLPSTATESVPFYVPIPIFTAMQNSSIEKSFIELAKNFPFSEIIDQYTNDIEESFINSLRYFAFDEKDINVIMENKEVLTFLRHEIQLPELTNIILTLNSSVDSRVVKGADGLSLRDYLSSVIIGQNHVIDAISKRMRLYEAQLHDKNKPISIFLLVGPTGVGKTQLVKEFNEFYFKNKDRLITIDCSEFASPHDYAKILGAPPGYVGHNQDDTGVLSKAKKLKSFTLLFDEIEKADDNFFNILLQLFSEGKLTSSKGEVVDFRESFIFLTSNIGIDNLSVIKNKISLGPITTLKVGDRNELINQSIKKKFRPEFINRLDSILYFNSLAPDSLITIIKNKLDSIISTITKFTVTYDMKFVNKLSELGYSEEYGVRFLNRVIEEQFLLPLAEKILTNDTSVIEFNGE